MSLSEHWGLRPHPRAAHGCQQWLLTCHHSVFMSYLRAGTGGDRPCGGGGREKPPRPKFRDRILWSEPDPARLTLAFSLQWVLGPGRRRVCV